MSPDCSAVGEFVPFREALPLMSRFAPYDFDYSISAGERQDRLPVGGHRFGVVEIPFVVR